MPFTGIGLAVKVFSIVGGSSAVNDADP